MTMTWKTRRPATWWVFKKLPVLVVAVSFSVVSIACAQENSAPIASLGDVIESLEINTQYAAETVELVNNAGDKLIISGPEDGENAVQKFAQLQYLFEAAWGDRDIQDAWVKLAPGEMQQVIDIHAWDVSFEWEGPAHEFYTKLQESFLIRGQGEYVENSFAEDDFYTKDEYATYWNEFVAHFADGIDSDLDYTAQYAPNFSRAIVALLPDHPLQSRLSQEIRVIKLASENESLASENESLASENESLASENESLASENESLASENAKMEAATQALRELNGTLEELNRNLSGE